MFAPKKLFELVKVRIIGSSSKGGGQIKGFHLGPIMWVSDFELWVAGPHNFLCCVG